jgi:hypothetical protein
MRYVTFQSRGFTAADLGKSPAVSPFRILVGLVAKNEEKGEEELN